MSFIRGHTGKREGGERGREGGKEEEASLARVGPAQWRENSPFSSEGLGREGVGGVGCGCLKFT